MQINVTDTRYVDINFVNARMLSVTHNFEAPKIIKENKEIIEINFGTYTIKVGSKIEITFKNKPKDFFVYQIIENRLGFNIICDELTKSSIFLFPLITGSNSIAQLYEYDYYFYNAYLYNKSFPEYNDGKHLFVVYRFFNTERFKELESIIQSNPNYIKTIEINSNFTMYIFELPKMFHSDSYYFIRGRYSRLSTTAKSKITLFHQAKKDDWLYLVLTKDSKRKSELERWLDVDLGDMELYTKPIKELESYD